MPIYRRASRHPVNAPRDRVDISCPTCHGAGKVNRHVMSPEELKPVRYDDAKIPDDSVEYLVERVPCDTCAGQGYVTPKDGDRVDVLQDGRKVGSCTVPATVRPHPLVDRRHGDYRAACMKVG